MYFISVFANIKVLQNLGNTKLQIKVDLEYVFINNSGVWFVGGNYGMCAPSIFVVPPKSGVRCDNFGSISRRVAVSVMVVQMCQSFFSFERDYDMIMLAF